MFFHFYEKDKEVLEVDIFKKPHGVGLKAYMGKDLHGVLGHRLEDELGYDFVVAEISLSDTNVLSGDMQGLYPGDYGDDESDDEDMAPNQRDFFKFFQRTPRPDAPAKYDYLLNALYLHIKPHLVTPQEKEFFKGIGTRLLCWMLTKIDATGDKILALEADGTSELDPAERIRLQKSLVAFYERLGFRTCAADVEERRFWNSSVCMYAKFSDVLSNCRTTPRRFSVLGTGAFEA